MPTALCNPRDIRRLQMELQFISINIVQSNSTSNLDTSTYKIVAKKVAKVEEKVEFMVDSSRDEPPSSLELVQELHSNMSKLLDQVKYLQEECTMESASVYALVDVLKQLEQTTACVNQDLSLIDPHRCQKFLEEVEKLQIDLEQVQHTVTNVPGVPTFSHDVGRLNVNYSSMLQELEQRNSSEHESEVLRRKIIEMERH